MFEVILILLILAVFLMSQDINFFDSLSLALIVCVTGIVAYSFI